MDKNYKRKWRELSPEHIEAIRQGMLDYWKGVESRGKHTTMDELLGKPNADKK